LKASNIMNTTNGTLKLVDYTISIFLNHLDALLEPNVSSALCYWLPPEINADRMYDYRCDIWSIGCLTYELITGLPPFLNKTRGVKADFLRCLANQGRAILFLQ